MKQFLFALAGLGTIAVMPSAAIAQDTGGTPSWGCQVLLCAASSNPSWHGVPYCVPPMTKLIKAMAKPGFSWPICHEAKSGKPGYQPYEDCPSGFKEASNMSDRGAMLSNRCEKTINTCTNKIREQNKELQQYKDVQYRDIGNSDRGNSCRKVVSIARPMRNDPYFIDIPDYQGLKGRYWFNLKL